jgi:hypothetical protein
MNTSSVSQAVAQQPLQRLHAAPVIPSQRQLGQDGLPTSPFEPATAVKVGQAMAGAGRGHLLNKVV